MLCLHKQDLQEALQHFVRNKVHRARKGGLFQTDYVVWLRKSAPLLPSVCVDTDAYSRKGVLTLSGMEQS